MSSNRLKRLNRHSVSLSLIRAIEFCCIPLDIFWLIISRTSFGLASFILAGIGAVLSLGFGIGAFIYNYTTSSQTTAQQNDELSKLQKNSPGLLVNKNIVVSKAESIMTGVGLSILLATTIYWGITDVLVSLEFISAASALVGPLALIIAGAIAISAGIFFGIKHYQAKKNQQLIVEQIQQLKKEQEIVEKVEEKTIKKGSSANSLESLKVDPQTISVGTQTEFEEIPVKESIESERRQEALLPSSGKRLG
jgi:hypothetical protein